MKGLTDLLPIGTGVAVVGVITWLLLDRNIVAGKWLLAALLFAHGWVHLMFVFPQPESAAATAGGLTWPFDMSRSWLIQAGLDQSIVLGIGRVVMIATVIGFVASALATLGILVPTEWWAGLVVGSAALSTLMLVLFFAPALVLGFAINGVLIWLALASAWSPAQPI